MSVEIDIESLSPMEKIQLEFYLQVLSHLSASNDMIDEIHAKLHGDEDKEPSERKLALAEQIKVYDDYWPDELLKLKLLSKLS